MRIYLRHNRPDLKKRQELSFTNTAKKRDPKKNDKNCVRGFLVSGLHLTRPDPD